MQMGSLGYLLRIDKVHFGKLLQEQKGTLKQIQNPAGHTYIYLSGDVADKAMMDLVC